MKEHNKNGSKVGTSAADREQREPIAIVGMACRYPGNADNPETFWRILSEGRDCIREITADRWSLRALCDPEPGRPGKTYSRYAGLVEQIDQFDPQFFGISPREAQAMDPQQRLLLETAWEAMEDAGIVPEKLAGSHAGVFIGISTHDYGDLMSQITERKSGINPYLALGSALCIAANRISYCLDLRGPSLAIDTACSSSLVAMHQACECLWNGDASLAFVGGSNAIIRPEMTIGFSNAAMLSPDGRCKSFDAAANGYVRAEGAGMLVLKPLAAARRDSDRVYAVILATAVNQDGQTPGISVPNGAAQAALVREACARAGVRPRDVQYIEAHGTGTTVGDPIEANALGSVVGVERAAEAPCIIGSVKSNIGHLEAGAGVAGVMKTALALYHRQIPPNLHFTKANPQIDMEALRLRVPTQLEPWPETNGGPRLAGVNSFGFGGTNAHAVLAEMPSETSRAQKNGTAPAMGTRAWLLPLSARGKEPLRSTAQRWCEFLTTGRGSHVNIADLAYTAATRRSQHAHRLALVADSRQKLVEHLQTFLAGEQVPGLSAGRAPAGSKVPLVFVFTGMGPQWWAMGQQLLREEPVFRASVERCDRAFRRYMRDSMLEEMAATEDRSRIHDDRFAHMGVFVLQVSLAALWQSWGIHPDMIVGHSVGEVAAAYVSGALSFEDAVHVSFHRGRLQHQTRGQGKMLAVGLPLEEARRLLLPHDGQVTIAAINGPQAVTLSGDADALTGIHEELSVEGTFARFLQVDVPYHSPKMDCMRDELVKVLASLSPREPTVPLVSTVTGKLLDKNGMNAAYWWRNVRDAVQFAPAIQALLDTGHNLFLEIGPHPVLGSSIQECALARDKQVTVLASLRRKEPERANMFGTLGRLYTTGFEVDWKRLHPQGGHLVSLPTYPWQRERFWHESEVGRQLRTGEAVLSSIGHFGPGVHPLLGHALVTAHAEPAWNVEINVQSDHAWLADHRVQGAIVFPAAAHVEMALAAASQLPGDGFATVAGLELDKFLFLSAGTPQPVQLLIDRFQKSFGLYGKQADGPWVRYSAGHLERSTKGRQPGTLEIDQVRARCPRTTDKNAFYEMFKSLGLEYGPVFAEVEQLWIGAGEALSRIAVPNSMAAYVGEYVVFPGVLDAAFQTLLGAVESARPRLYLPARIGSVRVQRRLGLVDGSTRNFWSHARLVHQDQTRLEGDIAILDEKGNVLVEIKGLRCQALAKRGSGTELPLDQCLQREIWLLAAAQSRARPNTTAWTLPDPLEVCKAIRPAIAALVDQTERGRRHQDAETKLRELSLAYFGEAFGQLGWQFTPGTRSTEDEMAQRLRITAEQRPLFRRVLQLFQAVGIVQEAEGQWQVLRTPVVPGAQQLWRDCVGRFPGYLPRLQLLQTIGPKLAAVLRGEVAAGEVLCPSGSSTALTCLYQSDPAFRACNSMVQLALMDLVQRIPTERPLRILEIGGQSGSLTAQVLPVLPPQRTSYVFTDPVQEQVAQARESFADRPFVCAQVLDIEQNPQSQGFELDSFDIILACDGLHCTADPGRALENIKKLLVSSGLVLLAEPTEDFLLPVFGNMKTLSRFSDREARTGSPVLPAARWLEVLRNSGFPACETITDLPEEQMPTHALFLAQGPPLAAGEDAAEAAGHTPGDWLILTDQSGRGEQLAGALKEQGARVVLAWQGESYQQLEEGMYRVRCDHRADLEQLLQDGLEGASSWTGIAFLWGLDLPPLAPANLSAVIEQQARLCDSIVELTRATLRQGLGRLPRLWAVTQGTQTVGGAAVCAPAQAVLWGIGRVVANEHPELRCSLLDLSPVGSADEIQALAHELADDGRETELALRGSNRYVHRLVPLHVNEPVNALAAWSTDTSSRVAKPYRLETGHSGLMDELTLRACGRFRPGPNQVEIEVHATPLNFKDVAKAMHLLGDASLEGTFSGSQLGLECAGRIVAVGADVAGFQLGDDVVCLAPSSFASHVIADVKALAHKPAYLTIEEAATLPVVYLTVYYGLHHLARLQPGERVLIHAASGGVGLAAIQLAGLLGAEVFATAGSPEKRAFLRSLGVQHVMDSRSLDFADEVLALTGGEGVDVVLNSLGGETLVRSLSLLRECGRFVELGKRDLEFNTKVGLRPFLKQLSFFAVDLDRLVQSRPELTTKLFHEVMQLIEAEKLRPLPHVVYPIGRVREAFRTLLKARHIGKVVVSMREAHIAVAPQLPAAPSFRADGTHVITGGLGGFGLAAAHWLVDHGARHLLLLGRNGAASASARDALAQLEQAGATVTVARVDVASSADLARVLAEARQTLPPIRGVFHAAMVLDDAVLLELTRERFLRVLAPKVAGAWNLHEQTRDDPIEHFVLFSSCAALIGNPAQGNYVAANQFLDVLAHYRRGLGLPALAIDWGVVRDVGVVAARTALARHLENIGMIPLPARAMLDALGVVMQTPIVQTSVLHADWALIGKNFPVLKDSPRFSMLLSQAADEEGENSLKEGESLAQLMLAIPANERHGRLQSRVCEVVARVLGTSATKLDTDEPMTKLGMDSLMAVELATRIKKELQIDIPTMTFIRGPSITQLTTSLLELLLPQDDGDLSTEKFEPELAEQAAR